MALQNIYNTPTVRGTPTDTQNALISTDLDSVKPYQFEVHIDKIPGNLLNANEIMIGAVKVTGLGMETEVIEVHRVNDKVYYPSKAKLEPVVITFDDQLKNGIGEGLWLYLSRTFNMVTGEIATSTDNLPTTALKIPSMKIVQLNNSMQPFSETILYGVYPMAWKSSEFNYATTTSFHTIDVSFRCDFMKHKLVD